MKLICERKYGEPKLKKPKFLNNSTLVGSVKWMHNKCTNKIWKVEDVYYMLVRDWFSNCISLDEAVELGIIDGYNHKFVYNDNFGSVVLRNEAIISFTKDDWYYGTPSAPTNMCLSLEKLLKLEEYSLVEHTYENLFENTLKLIGADILNTDIGYIPKLKSYLF